jgi:hypothetical protein
MNLTSLVFEVTYIHATHDPRKSSRDITDIPPRTHVLPKLKNVSKYVYAIVQTTKGYFQYHHC